MTGGWPAEWFEDWMHPPTASGCWVRSTMRAAAPTTGPAHPFSHFVETHLYTSFPGLVLLGRRNPADPLIPRQRCDICPHFLHYRFGLDRFSKIRRHPMYATRGGVWVLSLHDVKSTQETYLVARRWGGDPSATIRCIASCHRKSWQIQMPKAHEWGRGVPAPDLGTRTYKTILFSCSHCGAQILQVTNNKGELRFHRIPPCRRSG
jgi:hypothetical protein